MISFRYYRLARALARPARRFSPGSSRSLVSLGVVALILLAGCGVSGSPATPTPAITPTPAPRPTADTPARVSVWSPGALDEGAVEVRAALTASEIDELTRTFTRHYPKLTVHW